jgi:hypothetical protein
VLRKRAPVRIAKHGTGDARTDDHDVVAMKWKCEMVSVDDLVNDEQVVAI